jgi:hypothetical protein
MILRCRKSKEAEKRSWEAEIRSWEVEIRSWEVTKTSSGSARVARGGSTRPDERKRKQGKASLARTLYIASRSDAIK